MNPNVIQMAQDNAIPAAHHFNPEQPSQRYLPFAYEAPRGRSQGFQGAQRETTGGRPGGTRSRDFSNARCGRPCQPYRDGMAGPETQVGGSRLCRQAAAPITPQAGRGPGVQVTAKPQPQRNFEITGPKHPRCSSKSSEFRAAVTSQPQESFCWERETPASKSGVPRAPSCRERDFSAAATTRPAAVGNPPSPIQDLGSSSSPGFSAIFSQVHPRSPVGRAELRQGSSLRLPLPRGSSDSRPRRRDARRASPPGRTTYVETSSSGSSANSSKRREFGATKSLPLAWSSWTPCS
ncbi:hypothetical protein MTO96_014301 [Rhipicephalus appendiculatus]